MAFLVLALTFAWWIEGDKFGIHPIQFSLFIAFVFVLCIRYSPFQACSLRILNVPATKCPLRC